MQTKKPALVYFLLLFSVFGSTNGVNDVLGCGGYVRSDVDINYDQVGIKLFTQQGNLKYETECAPNNGYYFMPIYDKGNYVIKVSPPPGWSFEPNEVAIKIDGQTDACSVGKDINFHFKGFAVIGKVVSAGSNEGPKGVTVQLYRDDTLVQTRDTEEGGVYVFTPLSSGRYTVSASHPTWTFFSDKVEVEVSDGNGDAGSSLVVAGYTISGYVTTDAQPTPGVAFILHATHTLESKPVCDPGLPEGYTGDARLGDVICHTKSGSDGSFKIGSVRPGVYQLVPYFHSPTTRYEVTPATLTVTVLHNDLVLANPFKIEGFSTRGRVRRSKDGPGVAGAKVTLDRGRSTTTDNDGHYVFENVQSGKHKLKVAADKYEFEEATMNINPQRPIIEDMTPLKYEVCFSVQVEKTAQHTGPWKVEVNGVNGGAWLVTTGEGGRGCTFLPPAKYKASVKLTPQADNVGLRFGPLEHAFSVTSDPIDNLSFSQFLGEISGEIKCIEKCPPLSVTLRSATGGSSATPRTVTAIDGRFSIGDVIPGAYTLSVVKEEWCWNIKSLPVTVDTQNIQVSLEQTGYQLTIASSHETSLSYSVVGRDGVNSGDNSGTGPKSKGTGAKSGGSRAKSGGSRVNSDVSGTILAQKGSTFVCLSSPGKYSLTPIGCHKFSSSQIEWNTASPKLITLSAVAHQLTGAIRATEVAQFNLQVKNGDKVSTQGPLNPSPEDPNLYIFEIWVREGETVNLTPSSPSNLYQYEPSTHTLMMPSDCVLDSVTFEAERALFIHGRVTPPISGVSVSVEGCDKVHAFTTDAEGRYSAGPLDNSCKYSVTAEKKGYIMNPLSEKGFFEAYKLAEVIVEVKDEEGRPLAGVLISMSGGSSYRQNSLTESDGTIAFLSLTPADYFLRPMMKEYTFEPASKMVTVEEGATIVLNIKGLRIAYSVYGQALSLSGEPESDVVIEAVGREGECLQYQEEAVSDAHGHFRIRGLLPKCEYDLRLKQGNGINTHVQRTLPATRKIHTGNQDLRDLRLTILRPFNQMDVAGKIETDPQHLSSLVARLYRDDYLPDSPIHTIKLGPHPYFMLPPMTADKRTYFLRVESSLPSSQYQFSNPEITFVADSSFKHLNLSFKPTLRSVDAEMSQGTVVGFAIAIILVTIAFNYNKVGGILDNIQDIIKSFSTKTNYKSSSVSSDVPYIEAVRKKAKSRKV